MGPTRESGGDNSKCPPSAIGHGPGGGGSDRGPGPAFRVREGPPLPPRSRPGCVLSALHHRPGAVFEPEAVHSQPISLPVAATHAPSPGCASLSAQRPTDYESVAVGWRAGSRARRPAAHAVGAFLAPKLAPDRCGRGRISQYGESRRSKEKDGNSDVPALPRTRSDGLYRVTGPPAGNRGWRRPAKRTTDRTKHIKDRARIVRITGGATRPR